MNLKTGGMTLGITLVMNASGPAALAISPHDHSALLHTLGRSMLLHTSRGTHGTSKNAARDAREGQAQTELKPRRQLGGEGGRTYMSLMRAGSTMGRAGFKYAMAHFATSPSRAYPDCLTSEAESCTTRTRKGPRPRRQT